MDIYKHFNELVNGDLYLNLNPGLKWTTPERIERLKTIKTIIENIQETIQDPEEKESIIRLKQICEILLNNYTKNKTENIEGITIKEINTKITILKTRIEELEKQSTKKESISKIEYERRQKILYSKYCKNYDPTIKTINPILDILIYNWKKTEKILEYTKDVDEKENEYQNTLYALRIYGEKILNDKTINYFLEIAKKLKKEANWEFEYLGDIFVEKFNETTIPLCRELMQKFNKEERKIIYYLFKLFNPELFNKKNVKHLIKIAKKQKGKDILKYIIPIIETELEKINWRDITNLKLEKIFPLIKKQLQKKEFNEKYGKEYIQKIIWFIYYITKDERFHILYAKQPDDFFLDSKNKNTTIKRKQFDKDGSRTVLLGGNLAHKAIIRVVSEEAFIFWKKAFEAKEIWKKAGFDYIPVEPILKKKNGKYRTYKFKFSRNKKWLIPPKWWPPEDESKEGQYYRVSTKVLGPSSLAVIMYNNNEKLNEKIHEKMTKIEEVLNEDLNIYHGHTHYGNFCIKMDEPEPKVYIIDFDKAEAYDKNETIIDFDKAEAYDKNETNNKHM